MIKTPHPPFITIVKRFFTLRLLLVFEIFAVLLFSLFMLFFYWYFYLPIIAQHERNTLATQTTSSSSNILFSEYESVVKFHQEKIDTGKKIRTNPPINPLRNDID
ncbi:MAG: hypothetical protein HYV32_00940 [Candidatus Kerfeldbacteria bacterium]|nr:hypothetical protein [Candidatus Kerfeldbacteria bacterium]